MWLLCVYVCIWWYAWHGQLLFGALLTLEIHWDEAVMPSSIRLLKCWGNIHCTLLKYRPILVAPTAFIFIHDCSIMFGTFLLRKPPPHWKKVIKNIPRIKRPSLREIFRAKKIVWLWSIFPTLLYLHLLQLPTKGEKTRGKDPLWVCSVMHNNRR